MPGHDLTGWRISWIGMGYDIDCARIAHIQMLMRVRPEIRYFLSWYTLGRVFGLRWVEKLDE